MSPSETESQDRGSAISPPRTDFRWRLALLLTTLFMGAALVTSGIDRYRSATLSSRAITEAEVHAMLLGARRELGRAAGLQEEILSSMFEELGTRGLKCLALIEPGGEARFSYGEPEVPFELPEVARHPHRGPPIIVSVDGGRLVHAFLALGRGKAPWVHEPGASWVRRPPSPPVVLAVELEPKAAAKIVSSARFSLVLEIGAAVILLFAAGIFWRLSRQAEKLADQMESERIGTARRLERDAHLKKLGQMSAVLGHELRNPLASLKGHAQLLDEKLEAGHPAKAQAQVVGDEVKQLEALTSQVLDFARTGALKLSRVYLDDLINSAVTFADADPVEVKVSEDLPPWNMDRGRMEQVLVNLLRNARQASPPDHPIALEVIVSDSLEIEIRDFGKGIPPGQEERIFEPFHTSRAQGTGLGLALARRIVEGHGGSLNASNYPGGGAVFTVRIPRESGGTQ